jgi:hypothetical protein
MQKDTDLFDLDFTEIEARVIAAMAVDDGQPLRSGFIVAGSVTGWLPSPLPPLHKLPLGAPSE